MRITLAVIFGAIGALILLWQGPLAAQKSSDATKSALQNSIFCTEKPDPKRPERDLSECVASMARYLMPHGSTNDLNAAVTQVAQQKDQYAWIRLPLIPLGFYLPAFVRLKSADTDTLTIQGLDPDDSAILESSFALRWDPVPNAANYQVTIAAPDGRPEWQQSGLTGTSANPDASVAAVGLHFWSVYAYDPQGRLLARTDSTFEILDPATRDRIRDRLPSSQNAQELTKVSADAAHALVQISRASVFEEEGLPGNALAEYRQVAQRFPQTVWIDAKISELEAESWQRALMAAREQQASVQTLPFSVNLPFDPRSNAPWAVVAGINGFEGASPNETLNFAGHDAAQFANYLRSAAGADAARILLLCTQPKNAPASLANDGCSEQVSKAQLEQALQLVFLLSKPSERIYIFLSGHAATDHVARGSETYLMASDSSANDKESTAIKMSWVNSLISQRTQAGGHVVLFLDVCRANAFGEGNGIVTKGYVPDAARLAPPAPVFGFLSSGASQRSIEISGLSHGVFSYYVFQGLQSQSANQVVSGEALFRYVRQNVAQATQNRQQPESLGHLDQLALPLAASTEVFQESGLNTLDKKTRRLISLENDAQSQLDQYLLGEDGNQTPAAFERGKRLMEEATAIVPHSPLLEARLAFFRGRLRTFERAGDPDKRKEQFRATLADLEQAIAVEPNAAYGYNALGIAYLETGEYASAATSFRDAVSRAPFWLYPLHNLAITYGEMGDYDRAISTYRDAMRLDDRPYLHYDLGVLYERLNRLAEARKEWAPITAREPSGEAAGASQTALLEMDLAARRLSVESARAKYEQLLKQYPNQTSARHNLALLYYYRKPQDRAAAVRLWKENLAQNPDFIPSLLSSARALMVLNDRNALDRYQRLGELRPANLDFRLELSAALSRFGSAEQAEHEIAEVLKTEAGYLPALEQRGDNRASEHATEAAAIYRSAARLVTKRAEKACLERKARAPGNTSGAFCLASREP